MRIVTSIDEREVIERILRHLGLWEQGVRVTLARPPQPTPGNASSSPAAMTLPPTTKTNR